MQYQVKYIIAQVGVEPVILAWKASVLTTWPTELTIRIFYKILMKSSKALRSIPLTREV